MKGWYLGKLSIAIGWLALMWLLIAIGCSGNREASVAPSLTTVEELLYSLIPEPPKESTERGLGDACAWVLTEEGGGKVVWIKDKEEIQTVTVVWLFPDKRWGYQRYQHVPGIPCLSVFPVPFYRQAQYSFSITNPPGKTDSIWKIDREGNLIRLWPSGQTNCPESPSGLDECPSPPPNPPEWQD